MLKGYRTNITAVLIFLVQAVYALGWIDADTATTLHSVLVGGGLIFLRAGIANK